MFEHHMNFEGGQDASDEDEALNRLATQKLEELGEPWSIEKSVEAVNWAMEQINPDTCACELVYEFDGDQ